MSKKISWITLAAALCIAAAAVTHRVDQARANGTYTYTLPANAEEVISISNTRAGLGVAYRGKDGNYYMIQYSGMNSGTEDLFKFTRSK